MRPWAYARPPPAGVRGALPPTLPILRHQST